MTTRDFLIECISACYAPRETRPIADWARENITLDAGENRVMSGNPYDINNTPYNRVVFEFIQAHDQRELIVVKSSQVGLTLGVFIGIGWLFKHRPGNVIYCMRDLDAVRETGKRRLVPLLKQIGKEEKGELDERDQTCITKSINGATLRLIGAQSTGGMISWPASYIFLDEYEVHPVHVEGATGDLARARTKGDEEYKALFFSKPQDEPKYEIDKTSKRAKLVSGQGTRCMDEYYSGTQEKYHVPCPHCGHFQELVWSQMKLGSEAITSAPGVLPVEYDLKKFHEATYYECCSCKGHITDRQKKKMCVAGKWVPTPPEQRLGPYKTPYPNRRSIQISDLYVFLFANANWGALMLKWHEAQGDDEKLDAFYNDHLGLPRPERKSAGKVEPSAVERLVDTYPRLRCYDSGRRWVGPQVQLTFEPLFLGVTIDKQDGYLKFTIVAYIATGEPYVVDWGILANEEDVIHLLQNFRVKSASGEEFGIYCGLMDCGFRRSKVIEFCHEIRGLIPYFAPARGIGRVHSRASVWVMEDTSIPNSLVQVVNFDSQAWEDDLYRRRIIEFDPKKIRKRYPRIHLPIDADDDYKAEICNAVQVEEVKGGIGQGTYLWQKANTHQPNDYGDCLKMALILWVIHAPEEVAEAEA